MLRNSRLARFYVGLLVVFLLLSAGFIIISSLIPNWGATSEEVSRTYPGDEILPSPVVVWTHALTIHATPQQVWPWIVQIGDTRGGFYSYMFIENLIAGTNLYKNADHVIPEYQHPPIGQGMIADMLVVGEYEPEKYLMAESRIPGLGWTWCWTLDPLDNGYTRLVVRMRIQPNGMDVPSIVGSIINVGGFIMEQNHLQGLKLRAEGGFEFPYIEPVEIILWVLAFIMGVIAAVLFVRRKEWGLPLVVGVVSILFLFVLTFIQPPIWLRFLMDLILAAGVWRLLHRKKHL